MRGQAQATRPARGGEWLRIRAAATLLGVSPNTLRRAEGSALIPCHRSPGGHRRYRRRDIEALLASGETITGAKAPRPQREEGATVDRRVADLSQLVDASLEINSLLGAPPEELLHAIAMRLVQIANADVCDVYTLEGDHLRALVSVENGAIDAAWEGTVMPVAGWPAASTALATRQPCIVDDAAAAGVPPDVRRELAEFEYKAQLSLPLVVRGENIGLVELCSFAPHDFTGQLELVRGLARVAAYALDNATLLQHVERNNAVLSELVDLGTLVAQTRDVQALLQAVAERLRRVCEVECCELYLIDGTRFSLVAGDDGTPYGERWIGWSAELAEYATVAAAVGTGEVMTIASLDDPRLSRRELDDLRQFGHQSKIVIPLASQEGVVGFLDLFDTRPRDYDEYAYFLRGVGQLVAGALQSAMLFEQVEHHNATLGELVEIGALATRSRDVDPLVNTISERIMRTVGAESCEIYLIEGERLRLLAAHDATGPDALRADWVDDLANYPATAAAVAAREVLIIASLDDPRLSEFERQELHEYGFASEICVPLVVDDRAIGVIDIFDDSPRDYAESVDFLRSVAPVLSGALDGALLVDRLKGTTRDLRQLVDCGLEFGSTLDLDDVLGTIARRMSSVVGTDAVDIYTVEGEKLRGLLSFDHDRRVERFSERTFSWRILTYYRAALESKAIVSCEDVMADARSTAADKAAAGLAEYRATLQIPLIVHGRVIGLASMFSREPRSFARTDLLHGLSSLAAQALANASHYRDLDTSARRMRIVAEAGMQFSATLDVQSVLLSAASSLTEVTGLAEYDVYSVRDDRIECVASVVGGESCRSWLGTTVPLEEWRSFEIAVKQRSPLAIPSIDDPRLNEAERASMREWGQKSCIVIPLLAKDEVVAIVEVGDPMREREFDAEELATVAAISRVASLALDNALLYEDIKQLHLGNLKALSSALNAKDYYTLGHAARVAAYMVLLGKELGWPAERLQEVEEAAYLHDIGKIGVSDRILLKSAGLTGREWELMRQHPVFSADIIKPLFSPELVAGVRHHHERFDGNGYPDGLEREAIPVIARAMCVVDSYDAMSFRRPYKHALTYGEAREELQRCRGRQFDPQIADAFLRVLDRLRERKEQAGRLADLAATMIDVGKHELLRTRDDEARPEYEEVRAVLRELRDANPPTRFVSTRAFIDDRYVIVVDAEEDPATASHIGDQVFADDDLPSVFAGLETDSTALYVDEFGVWVTGLSPVRNDQGEIVAVAAVDMAPPDAEEGEMEGLRSDVTQTFASMLHSAATRLSRAELDAITDGLTGLYNHRYLHERLSDEVERARDQNTSVSLLFCDLDEFKLFNDRFGHSAGDGALRAVARAVQGGLRHIDMSARYGGEEFAIVLVDTDREGALEVAERLREAVAAIDLETPGAHLSVSIGVAVFPEDASSKAELLDKADWAMYLAKRQGRDRVMSFADGQMRLPFV